MSSTFKYIENLLKSEKMTNDIFLHADCNYIIDYLENVSKIYIVNGKYYKYITRDMLFFINGYITGKITKNYRDREASDKMSHLLKMYERGLFSSNKKINGINFYEKFLAISPFYNFNELTGKLIADYIDGYLRKREWVYRLRR